jgi:nucleoporin p58/p45
MPRYRWEREGSIDDVMYFPMDLTSPTSSDNAQTTSSIAPTNTSTSVTTTGGSLGSLGLFNNVGGSSNTQQGQNVQNMFSGLGVGGSTTTTGGGLLGNPTASVSQSQPGGLFSGLGGNINILA